MFNRKLRKDIKKLQAGSMTARRTVSDLVNAVRELRQKVYLLENPFKFKIGEEVSAKILVYDNLSMSTSYKVMPALVINYCCNMSVDDYNMTRVIHEKQYTVFTEDRQYTIREDHLSKIIKPQSCNTSTSSTLNSTNQTLTSQENQEKK